MCKIDELLRVAIFSMWNEKEHLVELVRAGEGAQVTGFDGEGEGLKCMKELSWIEGRPVTFRISAELKVLFLFIFLLFIYPFFHSFFHLCFLSPFSLFIHASFHFFNYFTYQGEYWECSCIYIYEGIEYYLATYRRKGSRPLTKGLYGI